MHLPYAEKVSNTNLSVVGHQATNADIVRKSLKDLPVKKNYSANKILEMTVQPPRNAPVPTRTWPQRNESKKAAVLSTAMKHLCPFYLMKSTNLHHAVLVERKGNFERREIY